MTVSTITTFDADLEAIRETREQMRQLRRQLEEMDDAVSMAGPTQAELVAAEESTEAAMPERFGQRWWDEQFKKNWPEGKRKRRRWMPWLSRR